MTTPTTTVPLREAKERLGELLEVASTGEKIVITNEEGSAFQLVPAPGLETKKRGLIGSAKGWFTMSEDFDEPLEDFKEYM